MKGGPGIMKHITIPTEAAIYTISGTYLWSFRFTTLGFRTCAGDTGFVNFKPSGTSWLE